MPQHVTHRSSAEIASEIVAAFLWGPKTWPQVVAQVGLKKGCSQNWLNQLRASGVIHVCGHEGGRAGKQARVFALQSKPFALPDVEYPEAIKRPPPTLQYASITPELSAAVRSSTLGPKEGCERFGISRASWYRIRGSKTKRPRKTSPNFGAILSCQLDSVSSSSASASA